MKLFLLALSIIFFPLPSFSGSWQTIQQFTALIEQTGTVVATADCSRELDRSGLEGFYVYDKDNNLDHLIFCKENVNMEDSAEVWEVLSHESVHVMQACNGGEIIKDEYMPRVVRYLQSFAPHYHTLIQTYPSDQQRREIEAFYMELQKPEEVVQLFKQFCFD